MKTNLKTSSNKLIKRLNDILLWGKIDRIIIKYIISTKNLKQDLLFDYTNYSLFISKNSKLLNSEFPTEVYIPRKELNEKKLKIFFPEKHIK